MLSPSVDRLIRIALEEDIGPGDVTTASTIAPETMARAQLVAKEEFVLAGIDVARRVFEMLDARIAFEGLIKDGQTVRRGEVLAWLKGDAASLLQGERVALNLLQRLSGVATLTARFVRETVGTGAAGGGA